jgi:N,N'-diacetyllegionaminate synthase
MKIPFIIAEIGSNHSGDINIAKKLIKISKKSGASAVKFQLFKSFEFDGLTKDQYTSLKKNEFPVIWLDEIVKYAKKIRIELIFSVFGSHSLSLVLKYKFKYIKIASSEITNLNLLAKVANNFEYVILSTGMSSEKDIVLARETLSNFGKSKIIVLHCVADYPTNIKDLNLSFIDTLRVLKFHKIGFSDHTESNIPSIVSIGKGCEFFEKHITLSRKDEGPDHFYASEPNEFKQYVSDIKDAFKSLGVNKKFFSDSERKYGRRAGIYLNKNLKKNHIINRNDFYIKIPSLGIREIYSDAIIGKKIKRNVKKDNPIYFEDLY